MPSIPHASQPKHPNVEARDMESVSTSSTTTFYIIPIVVFFLFVSIGAIFYILARRKAKQTAQRKTWGEVKLVDHPHELTPPSTAPSSSSPAPSPNPTSTTDWGVHRPSDAIANNSNHADDALTGQLPEVPPPAYTPRSDDGIVEGNHGGTITRGRNTSRRNRVITITTTRFVS